MDELRAKLIQNGSVNYIIIPKYILQNNQDLYASMTICYPFPEASQPVKRQVNAKLVKISDLIDYDFESTINGTQFLPLSGSSVTASTNRLLDFIISGIETSASTDYINMFPNPTNSISAHPTIYTPLSGAGIPPIIGSLTQENITTYLNTWYPNTTYDQWVQGEIARVGFWTALTSPLLWEKALDTQYLDYYLNISTWFNFNDTKLGKYYQTVLKNIFDTKYSNKTYGDRNISTNIYDLDAWFDGFYTGERTYFTSISGTNTPWGTQNARYDIIKQVKNTLLNISGSEKFTDYELFFIDLSIINDIRYGEGFGTMYTSNSYPINTNDEFINNPFVSPSLSGYIPYDIVSISGITYTDETDFSIVDPLYDFGKQNIDSFQNFNEIGQTINFITFPITQSDMEWGFNSSIMFDNSTKLLPINTIVNAEFEYKKKKEYTQKNNPKVILAKETLGTSNGNAVQKFFNPDILYQDNVEYSRVHRIWLDNVYSTDYTLEPVGTTTSRLVINDIALTGSPTISVVYKDDNINQALVTNNFVDNFYDRRDINWSMLTYDKYGYSKINNEYAGFIIDTISNTTSYRKSTMSTTNGQYNVSVGGQTKGKQVIKAVTIGSNKEDILQLANIKKKNNFTFSTDLYFDTSLTSELMTSNIMFKGSFKLINGANYLANYYVISFNILGNNISLIQYSIEDGVQKSKQLAKINTLDTLIKRGTFYTVKVNVRGSDAKVYVQERYSLRDKLIFEYDLSTGPTGNNLMGRVERMVNSGVLQGGLDVYYDTPLIYNSEGDRFGISTITDRVYFSNIHIDCYESNNLRAGESFITKNYDEEYVNLKTKNGILNERIKKINKTYDGITLLLIGNKLFAKKGSADWIIHSKNVLDFVIVEKNYYIFEYIEDVENAQLITYTGIFEPIKGKYVIQNITNRSMLLSAMNSGLTFSSLEYDNGSVIINMVARTV